MKELDKLVETLINGVNNIKFPTIKELEERSPEWRPFNVVGCSECLDIRSPEFLRQT